ncbi:MAG TPA: TRAP transporter substrate-binding protein [Synergistaceae bacterium]|nr:TRAP transporter substrate-binding protein [Synergistaceae bacterium]
MRVRFTMLLVTAIALLLFSAAAFPAEYEINLGHTASISHHYHTSSELFAKLVAEKTGGKVNIVIFPAGQLGSLPDMTESVRLGTQDIVLTADPIIGNTIGEFEALYLPYIFRDYDHVEKFEESNAAKMLEDILRENGMVLLGWWENGFRVITNNKRPIKHPDDMAGLKLRIGESKMAIDTFVLLQANPTPIAMSELFAALQLGTVDGQENPTGRILSARYYEVQKYLSVTRHQHVFEPLVMNLDKFKTLPAEFQQALLDAGKEVAKADRKAVADTEADELAQLEQKGMLVNEVDVPAFQKALSPMYEQYMKERGEKWSEIVKMIQGL